VKVGDTVPLDFELLVLEDGSNDPKAVKVQDIVKGKKIVVFGLPGEQVFNDVG
jgi:peroxiredoxin